MRWIALKSFSGIQKILGRGLSPVQPPSVISMENIRQAMLEVLRESDRSQAIERRVRFAIDVQELWYLRGDIMAALSTLQGESAARRAIDQLTVMFRDLLPSGFSSRTTSLRG